MRYIQFPQQLTQHFSIIVVIVDVRQELTVSISHSIPVHSVHVHIIETSLFLTVHIIEHVFTFFGRQQFHAGSISDRLQAFRRSIHFLHGTSAQNKEVLTLFIHFHIRPFCIHLMQQLGVVFAEIHLPQIVSTFESRQVIQFLTVFRDNGRS